MILSTHLCNQPSTPAATTTTTTPKQTRAANVRLPTIFLAQKCFAIVIENVFSEAECQEIISLTEQKGYEKALVNIGGGREMKMTDIRNSDRCIVDDPVFAEEIWHRIREALSRQQDSSHHLRNYIVLIYSN